MEAKLMLFTQILKKRLTKCHIID